MAKKKKKQSDVDIVRETLHACFKSDVTHLMADVADASESAVPTLITAFDYGLLGIGGPPMGHFMELAGDDKSGKTTMLLHMAAAFQTRGIVPVVIDAKGAVSSDVARARRIGVDPEKLVIVPVNSSEEATQKAREGIKKIRKKGVKIVLFWDDIGITPTDYELSPNKDKSTKKDKSKPGDKAKATYNFCRTLAGTCYKLGTPIVVMNNLTSVINTGWVPVGTPVETSASGGGLRYTSRIRVVLKRGSSKVRDKNKREIGEIIKAETLANAFFSPFRKVWLYLDFRHGFNARLSTLYTALKTGYLTKKSGGKYQIKGSSRSCKMEDITPKEVYTLEKNMWPWIDGSYADPVDLEDVLDDEEAAEEDFVEGYV
jgi:recombination protein RecA